MMERTVAAQSRGTAQGTAVGSTEATIAGESEGTFVKRWGIDRRTLPMSGGPCGKRRLNNTFAGVSCVSFYAGSVDVSGKVGSSAETE